MIKGGGGNVSFIIYISRGNCHCHRFLLQDELFFTYGSNIIYSIQCTHSGGKFPEYFFQDFVMPFLIYNYDRVDFRYYELSPFHTG